MAHQYRDREAESAQKLRDEMESEMESAETGEVEQTQEKLTAHPHKYLFKKLRYEWKPEDQQVQAQVKAAVNTMLADEFSGIMDALDEFYQSVREYEVDENGVIIVDQEGRPKWARDQRGKIIEDWENLTGQDIEKALLDLSRAKVSASMRNAELLSEATFAKHIYNDSWHEAYEGAIGGTTKDRDARANSYANEDKYFFHFRYVLWMRSDAFLREVNAVMRTLEKVMDWRVRSQR